METTITHDIVTISSDRFTITHDASRGEFHVAQTHDIDPEVQILDLATFRKVFSNDPKVLALFGV